MSTKTLIDRLQPQCGGLNRSTGVNNILYLIQEGEDRLFDYDSPFTQWLPTGLQGNQGWPPYLKTVAGTYEYDVTAPNLCTFGGVTLDNVLSPGGAYGINKSLGGTDYPVRAKRVLKVFVDSTNIDYGQRWVGQVYQFSNYNPYTTATSRVCLADIPVDSWEALESTAAGIRFREDPGDTTKKYIVLFTWEAPRLLSEAIPLAVPPMFEAAIEDYVVGQVSLHSNGKYGERLERFEKFWIPKWRAQSAMGAQSTSNRTAPRPC